MTSSVLMMTWMSDIMRYFGNPPHLCLLPSYSQRDNMCEDNKRVINHDREKYKLSQIQIIISSDRATLIR